MREFEWVLNGDVVATGAVGDDGSVTVVVLGMAPTGFINVQEMEDRFAALPLSFELRWAA